jgi:large conductance mechanosensitive channel
MYIPLNGQATDLGLAKAKELGAVIAYGTFLNTVIEFFVIAFTIFLIVRQINRMRGTPPAKA